jgi:Holliday junction resolvase RusA-like endonuclease
MKKFTFKINPFPKVRMTARSKWSKRAQDCLAFQKMIAFEAVSQKVPKFGKSKVGFALLHFYRFGRDADTDNLQKSFYDGLQYGGIFNNDRQIKALDNHRIISVQSQAEARIEFIIYNLDDVQKQNDNNTDTSASLSWQKMSTVWGCPLLTAQLERSRSLLLQSLPL